jgi:glucose-6-phosphate 1-dehydrogenase
MNLVVLGAGGDLMSRYLLPALVELEEAKRLPEDLEVVGIARDGLDDDGFRDRMAEAADEHGEGELPESLRRRLRYLDGDATDPELLGEAVGDGPAVVYLALPPSAFEDVLEGLSEVGLADGSRVVMEKPFGDGVASAERLNAMLHEVVPEAGAFRVDHFLGHQTVQNVLGLRFANPLFEAVWAATHVSRVDIVWDETLTVEGRAGFYDDTGALRDMVQNHLLQLLCLVAMEPPESLDPDDVRDRKVDVLRAIRTPDPSDAADHSVRGRYGAGKIGDRDVPAYADEEGVDADRETETFAEVRFFIDNPRWSGVPFVLRTGKALQADRHDVTLHFHPVAHSPFGDGADAAQHLRLGIEPDEIDLAVALNGPGDPTVIEDGTLGCELAPAELGAYATVLAAVLEGDQLLSIRADEAEEAWRIVAPVIEAWEGGLVPLVEYAAGSDGPPGLLGDGDG